jgi:hypothetical protein
LAIINVRLIRKSGPSVHKVETDHFGQPFYFEVRLLCLPRRSIRYICSSDRGDSTVTCSGVAAASRDLYTHPVGPLNLANATSLKMKIFPIISQPTLDSFRKDVYRPRLALLFLLLLLGRDHINLSQSQEHKALSTLPTQGYVEQTVNADRTKERHLQEKSGATTRFIQRLPVPAFLKYGKEAHKGKEKSLITEVKRKAKGQLEISTPEQSSGTSQPSPIHPMKLPKLFLRLLWQGEVASAIIPLHILWAVRLGGMMLEDSIVKVRQASLCSEWMPSL